MKKRIKKLLALVTVTALALSVVSGLSVSASASKWILHTFRAHYYLTPGSGVTEVMNVAVLTRGVNQNCNIFSMNWKNGDIGNPPVLGGGNFSIGSPGFPPAAVGQQWTATVTFNSPNQTGGLLGTFTSHVYDSDRGSFNSFSTIPPHPPLNTLWQPPHPNIDIIRVMVGDLNGDGVVDGADLAILQDYIWFDGPPPENYLAADITNDGSVTLVDLQILGQYLNQSHPRDRLE